jgi:hypothetical protein
MQRVDLYQPIVADKPGPAPLALRVGITNAPSLSEGVPAQPRPETYVLLSALPEELRRRVELACQAIIAGR